MTQAASARSGRSLDRHTWNASDGGVDAMVSRDGFVLVPNLATAAVAGTARAALKRAAARLAVDEQSTWRNPKGTWNISWASRLVPGLAESPIRSAARALAADIIGGRVVERFDYALATPPGGRGAGWHRDKDSFVLSGVDRRVHIWVALQDVDESNGCLSYVPRGSDRDDGWEEMAVACRAPAGAALVHDEDTLHRSGPNDTGEPRWAWILQFAATSPARETLFALDRARASLLLRQARRRLAEPGTP